MNDQALLETMQRIGGLLFRRLRGDLSQSEEAVLREWLDQQDPAGREFFEQTTDEARIEEALRYLYGIDEDTALAEVLGRIQGGENRNGRRLLLWKRRYRYAAAAAVLVLIAGASVLLIRTRNESNMALLPVAQRYRNDVFPGGDKALLELSDGSRITLDSASDGEVARQGTTRVLKLDNGALAYHAGSSAAGSQGYGYNTISTPRGGQYQVLLPDGSKVWLNAASSLRFPTAFTGGERLVELTGEAYFQIASDASRPFKVHIPSTSTEIQVLGTDFNVEAYAEEGAIRTTLIGGAVRVTASGKASVLKPGQQASVSLDSTGTLSVISTVHTDDVIAWKNGLFKFEDAPIQSIMRQVSRWYDVNVVYNGRVDQQFIGTIPRQVPLSTLLKILESTGWVHFMIQGKKVIVMP